MTNSVADIRNTAQTDITPVHAARNENANKTTAFGEEFGALLPENSRPIPLNAHANEASSLSGGKASGGRLTPFLRSVRSREYPAPSTSPPAAGGSENPHGDGFVRSNSALAPHLLRFESVPEGAKFPNGPYRQAPEQFGGEWWHVNPFTGPEPWLRLSQLTQNSVATEALPRGFVEIFGPRPTRNAILDYFEFRQAKLEWEQNLKYFKQTGAPQGLDQAKLEAAEQAFQEWGLGKPVFYEGRYGWKIRFPEGAVPRFQMNPQTAVQAPHLVIAKYQIRLLQQGSPLDNPHPWVPPHLLTPGREQA